METDHPDLVERIAERATAAGVTVAVAESLTGGELAAHLATGPGASSWFRGGIVAYSPEVKQRVLGVPIGPVVTRTAAVAMADGVAELLGADVTVSVTGVGGPDPQESQPPGTMWWAVHTAEGTVAERASFDGSPVDVVASAVELALGRLESALA